MPPGDVYPRGCLYTKEVVDKLTRLDTKINVMTNKLQYGNYEVLVPLSYIIAAIHKIKVCTIQQSADKSHIPNSQFKRHFGVPYSRFKEGVSQTCN
jgi:hypothetical protein